MTALDTGCNYIGRVLRHASSMMGYWDTGLRCRYANHAYETWFGIPRDQLLGKTLQELLGPEIFESNRPYIEAVLKGMPQVFERLITGADGVKRHSLARYHPDIVDGVVVGFVAEVSEVGMLKRTEAWLQSEISFQQHMLAVLRKKEDALESAQALGRMGSWEWEIKADITTWSSGLYQLFGFDPRHLPPTYAEHGRLYAPASWCKLQEAVSAAVTHGTPYVLELEYRRPDDKEGWLEVRGEARRDSTGQVIALHGTAVDITETYILLSALRKQTCLLEHALRVAKLGIWRWHIDSDEIHFENQGACDIFDVSESEQRLVGANAFFRERIHPDDQSVFTEASRSFIEHRSESFDFHGRVLHGVEGKVRWVNCTGRAFDGPGNSRAMIGTVSDVTQWVESDLELKRSLSELQKYNARNAAFLFSLAHELRNCIAPIKGGLQLLQRKSSTQDFEKAERIMSRQLAHITRLVDDVYDLRRVQTGELELRSSRVNLNDIVAAAVDMCESAIARKAHRLGIALPDQEVWVMGDATRLTQAVVNLLSNACKFTPPGGDIDISLRVEPDGHALLAVRDNGIGLPESAVDSIFNLYAQIDPDSQNTSTGLGIGLYLVKSLVELHEGSVQAYSPGSGSGTVISIRLALEK